MNLTSKYQLKQALKRIWHFLWVEDSIWSWIANAVLAFVLIKFIVYPGLGLILSTSYPVVAVVSSSMEHNTELNEWWQQNELWYMKIGISEEQFKTYPFSNGFNKGDVMILRGKKAKDIKTGEVIVFRTIRPDPVIHRVVRKWEEGGNAYFQTKGDNNPDSIVEYRKLDGKRVPKETPNSIKIIDETDIKESEIIGNAVLRIPFIGYIKIIFVETINLFR